MSKTLKVGMIGCGEWAKVHIESWRETNKAEVVALASRSYENAYKLAKEQSVGIVCKSYDELICLQSLDIVVICVPTYLHYELSLAALNAGKHVFCEKPLALSFDEARKMWSLAKAKKVMTAVQNSRRNNSALIKMKEIISSGELGEIRFAEIKWCREQFSDPGHSMEWRFINAISGGGATIETGFYAIETARWLLGDIVSLVGNRKTFIKKRPLISGGTQLSVVENEDEGIFIANFANGAHATFRTSRLHEDCELSICGSLADVQWAEATDSLLLRKARQKWEEVVFDVKNLNIVSQFVDSVISNKHYAPSFYDGAKVHQVLDAFYRSTEKAEWVHLDAFPP